MKYYSLEFSYKYTGLREQLDVPEALKNSEDLEVIFYSYSAEYIIYYSVESQLLYAKLNSPNQIFKEISFENICIEQTSCQLVQIIYTQT